MRLIPSVDSVIAKLERVRRGAAPNDRRWRTIGLTAASALIERVIVFALSLLQIPLALHYLGTEAYGLWMTLTGILALFALSDLGLGYGLQNRVSSALGKDDVHAIKRSFVSGVVMLSLMALGFLLLSLPAAFFIDWAKVFSIKSPQVGLEARAAVLVTVASAFLMLPLGAVQRLAIGMQLGWAQSIRNIITSVLSLLALVLAAFLGASLPLFLLLMIGPNFLTAWGLFLWLRRHLNWAEPLLSHFSWRESTSLVRAGGWFLLPHIGGTIIGAAPPLIISTVLGAAAVTPFNLCARLLGAFPQFQLILLQPLWPAYSEALARGEVRWIRSAFIKSLFYTLIVVVLPCIAFPWWGPPVLRWWSGLEPAAFSHTLLVAIGLWYAVVAIAQAPAFLLNGLNCIKGQATYGFASVVLATFLMPFFTAKFGDAGPAVAMLCLFAPISLPLVYLEAWHAIAKRLRTSATPS